MKTATTTPPGARASRRDVVEQRLQGLEPQQSAAVGTAVGLIEVMTFQPMLYCKNASQQGLPLTLDPRVLYRGLAMSMCNMAILTGLQFPLAAMSGRLLSSGEARPLSNSETIAAGFLGGALSGLACSPMELTIINQQKAGTSLVATPVQLVRQHGAAALSRGLVSSCLREGIYTAGYLGIAPVLGKELRERHGLGTTSSGMLGAIGAGVIVGTLSHPFDTIKSCMQGDVGRTQFRGLGHTASTLLAQGGVLRFFSGWTWRTARMILGVFVMNETKIHVAPFLFPDHFAEVL